MKIEKNHIIIGLLLIALAIFGTQFMTIGSYGDVDIPEVQVKMTSISANEQSATIKLKTVCDGGFRDMNVVVGTLVQRTCGDDKITVKVIEISLDKGIVYEIKINGEQVNLYGEIKINENPETINENQETVNENNNDKEIPSSTIPKSSNDNGYFVFGIMLMIVSYEIYQETKKD